MYLIIAAFAGGAFGAAVGALPAFIFTGIMVIAGEAAGLASGGEAGAITGDIAFGPFFGPHISFAGGAAAAAYAAKNRYVSTDFGFHMAKAIAYAQGPKIDVVVVGGLFGILGLVITQISANFGFPWDPIAIAVVLSAFIHRLAFGYSLVGTVHGSGLLDMSPFENEEVRGDKAVGQVPDGYREPRERLAVEPWLPHQYQWGEVAFLGVFTGILGAFAAIATGSPFLAFGISAASLLFLNLGVANIPVTHHMTLPSSTAALAVTTTGPEITGALAGIGDVGGLVVGAIFGMICALFGELFQRIFYAHGDTHVDPPAAAIVFGTLLIAICYLSGLFGSAVWVPTP
jgi:hypothetical protein